jgi:hypothetical protein
MPRLWDYVHFYRWFRLPWRPAYWVRTIVEPNRYVVRFIAAAKGNRLDSHGMNAQLAAARLIWFGLLLRSSEELDRFIGALSVERDRLASLGGEHLGFQLGEIALERAIRHLEQRSSLLAASFQLSATMMGDNMLRTFLSIGSDNYEIVYPADTYVEEMLLSLEVLASGEERRLLAKLFELEAELYRMSFCGEEDELDNTSGVLWDLAVRLQNG